jgi:hypothetical protein
MIFKYKLLYRPILVKSIFILANFCWYKNQKYFLILVFVSSKTIPYNFFQIEDHKQIQKNEAIEETKTIIRVFFKA